jgi:hypothetical protein
MDAGPARILLNRYAAMPAKGLISHSKKMSFEALARRIPIY